MFCNLTSNYFMPQDSHIKIIRKRAHVGLCLNVFEFNRRKTSLPRNISGFHWNKNAFFSDHDDIYEMSPHEQAAAFPPPNAS